MRSGKYAIDWIIMSDRKLNVADHEIRNALINHYERWSPFRLSCTYENRALGMGTQAGWITTTQRGRDDLDSGKAMQQQQMTAWTWARLGEANRTEQRQGNGRWGRWFAADCREDIKMIRNRWRWISVISVEWHEDDGIFNANVNANDKNDHAKCK